MAAMAVLPPNPLQEIEAVLRGAGTSIAAYSAFLILLLKWGHEKFVVKPTVDIVPNGPIEIGFTIHGPVVGMRGLLAGHGKDVMVTRTVVKVTKPDGGRRVMLPKLARLGFEQKIDFPQPLPVKKGEVTTFNAIFANPEEVTATNEILRPVRDAWWARMNALMTSAEAAQLNAADIRAQRSSAEWPEFSREQIVLQAFDQILQRHFWTAGTYTLELSIFAYQRKKALTKFTNGFTLSDEDVTRLRANQVKVIAYSCDQPASRVGEYQWANMDYQTPVL